MRKGRWKQIATATGLSYRTVGKIAQGLIHDPGASKIETLANYFQRTRREAERHLDDVLGVRS